MTPIDLAKSLAKSKEPKDQIIGVAMIARGLSDDGSDMRMGWPVETSIKAAAEYLNLDPLTPEMEKSVAEMMPHISDALLNKREGVY